MRTPPKAEVFKGGSRQIPSHIAGEGMSPLPLKKGGKMKTYEGQILATGNWFGIIVSRFNGAIADKLLDGAIDCLVRHSAETEKIDIF